MTMNRTAKLLAAASLLAFLLCGCAAPPIRHADGYSFSVSEKAAATARSMVGRPYKYGGDSPIGFDCSGLVRYSYLTAGMEVPHGTSELRRKTHPIGADKIRNGDLVFFTQLGKKYSHVGIAVGSRQFVHAPSSGKKVRKDSLDDPYWSRHFLGARRF